jgi:hypothetical protein
MGKYPSNTTINYIVTHSFQTEFKEEIFIKESHAVPSKTQKILEEL